MEVLDPDDFDAIVAYCSNNNQFEAKNTVWTFGGTVIYKCQPGQVPTWKFEAEAVV